MSFIHEKLKGLGINIHVMTTGAAAYFQSSLWHTPGASAYFVGASFPYAQEEQEELLGFMPEHFCSEENAIDLASAAYMRAYKFGGKKPVGIGIAASVTSDREHKGDHRAFVCVITDDKVRVCNYIFTKGACNESQRMKDDENCCAIAYLMLADALDLNSEECFATPLEFKISAVPAEAKAKERFFARPFFAASGKRLDKLPTSEHMAIMPGAYNPPHEGHFGTAQAVLDQYNRRVVFEITTEPPHKTALTIQDMLKRAKNLRGHDVIFTRKEALYLDKARAFPGVPIVLGADAMVRMLDPKWGIDLDDLFEEFESLKTSLYVAGRVVDGKFLTRTMIMHTLPTNTSSYFKYRFRNVTCTVKGQWDISSTELRNKLGVK